MSNDTQQSAVFLFVCLFVRWFFCFVFFVVVVLVFFLKLELL